MRLILLRNSILYQLKADTIFRSLGLWFTSLSFLAAVGIIVYLFQMSLPALKEVGIYHFFTDRSWFPDSNGNGTFGLMPMIVSSLLVGALSTAFAVPLAFLLAIYTGFFASLTIRILLIRFVEVLGAIPSVVFGLIGLTVLVPLINQIAPPGTSLLAAVIVLIPMILPTATLFYFSALEAIPLELTRSAAALGISRTGFATKIVFPSVRRQVIAGGLLALARALGETIAVLMVAGNVIKIPESVFDPVRVLTANIALEMGYALGVHRSALFFTGLVMIVSIVVLAVFADGVTGLSKGRILSREGRQ